MRLWERISRAVSHLSSRPTWQTLGRTRRKTTSDPQTALIRDLTATGTPMSLASVKAALDAAASTQDSPQTNEIINCGDSLLPPVKSTRISFV